MDLSHERKRSIRDRLAPVLAGFDPDLHFITVFLDSERTNLAIVAQKDDHPVVLRLDYLRYVSMPDDELRDTLVEQLRQRPLLAASSDGPSD